MPDQPVAPLLVVGVAPSGGGDEHRRHPEHGRLRGHGGRLSHDQPGVGDQVVDLLHRPPDSEVGEVGRQRRLGGDQHPPAALQHLDQVALLLGASGRAPGGRGRPARTRTARSSRARPGLTPKSASTRGIGLEAVRVEVGQLVVPGVLRVAAPDLCPGSSPVCTRCTPAGRRSGWSARRTRCRRTRPPAPAAGRRPAAIDGPMIPVITSGLNERMTFIRRGRALAPSRGRGRRRSSAARSAGTGGRTHAAARPTGPCPGR